MDTLTNWISWQLHKKSSRDTEHSMGGSVKEKNVMTVCRNCIPPKFHSEFSQSVNEAQFCGVFPRSPIHLSMVSLSLSALLTLLLAVLSSCLPWHIYPLHPAKPIRDLRASLPINYHPNQCRDLWYRIICQISADGWEQVPMCHRPYPHGNLCSGLALLTLPNLLMVSHCAPGLQSSCLPPSIANA